MNVKLLFSLWETTLQAIYQRLEVWLRIIFYFDQMSWDETHEEKKDKWVKWL